MERRNYPLLIGLSTYLIILTVLFINGLSYSSAEGWLRQNLWSLIVAGLGPLLAIMIELMGVFRGKPLEFISVFIVYLLVLLAADFFVISRTYNSGTFLFILSELILLIYLLMAKMIIPKGEHFIVPLMVGLFLSLALWNNVGYSSNAGLAIGFGGIGIILVGGFAALGHRKDRGMLYVAAGLIISIVVAIVAATLPVMTMGFT